MHRLIDPLECRELIKDNLEYFTFDEEEWLSNLDNYALVSGDNVAFAEYKLPGVYWVHFCFNSARGRKAISLVKEIREAFIHTKEVRALIGLIELKNKKARWLIRQAEFESLGEIETHLGRCELFYWLKGTN